MDNYQPSFDNQKEAVGVGAMAAMMGISTQRLYQLIAGGYCPPPVYSIQTKRPLYTPELQQVCLDVKRRNFGINGKVIMFYSKRTISPAPSVKSVDTPVPTKKTKASRGSTRSQPGSDQASTEYVELLRELGIEVSGKQVSVALKNLFPDEIPDQGEVVKALCRTFKPNSCQNHRKNKPDN